VGSFEGNLLGFFVGLVEGDNEGRFVGHSLGLLVGCVEGV